MQQVWFVTGSSRGFGRALVRAALEAGDLVAATARRPEQLADLAAEQAIAFTRSPSTSPLLRPPARQSTRLVVISAGSM